MAHADGARTSSTITRQHQRHQSRADKATQARLADFALSRFVRQHNAQIGGC